MPKTYNSQKRSFSLLILTKIFCELYLTEMEKNEHLTKYQLLAYSTGSLKGEEEHEAGRHLLLCDQCLKRMPPPTVERFWQTLMDEREMS